MVRKDRWRFMVAIQIILGLMLVIKGYLYCSAESVCWNKGQLDKMSYKQKTNYVSSKTRLDFIMGITCIFMSQFTHMKLITMEGICKVYIIAFFIYILVNIFLNRYYCNRFFIITLKKSIEQKTETVSDP